MTTDPETRLRVAGRLAASVARTAVVLQWAALVIAGLGLVSAGLRYDEGYTPKLRWSLVLPQATYSLGWAALVLLGSAGLRLWAARLELDIASRYDTSD